MAKITKKSGDDWEIRLLDGRRTYRHTRIQTLEIAREIIDLVTDDDVRFGRTPQRYLICNREWTTRYDEDGHFVGSDELVTVVEEYPKEGDKNE